MLQQVLYCDLPSARTEIVARYGNFFKSLLTSTSMEVATMANLVARDLQSTTGQNIRMLEEASGMCVWEASMSKLKEAVQQKEMVEVNN